MDGSYEKGELTILITQESWTVWIKAMGKQDILE